MRPSPASWNIFMASSCFMSLHAPSQPRERHVKSSPPQSESSKLAANFNSSKLSSPALNAGRESEPPAPCKDSENRNHLHVVLSLTSYMFPSYVLLHASACNTFSCTRSQGPVHGALGRRPKASTTSALIFASMRLQW